MSNIYKISIILSTHNRPELLFNCLESLSNQSLAHSKYEIILVDNYSADNGKKRTKFIKILKKNILH